jgi:hypothetical protein
VAVAAAADQIRLFHVSQSGPDLTVAIAQVRSGSDLGLRCRWGVRGLGKEERTKVPLFYHAVLVVPGARSVSGCTGKFCTTAATELSVAGVHGECGRQGTFFALGAYS